MSHAVLFDFNGVIADDEHLHFEAFRAVLAEEGVVLAESAYVDDYLGLDDRGMLAAALYDAGGGPAGEAKLAGLVARKAAVYARLAERGVPLFPGARELVGTLAGTVPLALVSGALRSEIERILEEAGLLQCFDVVVSAEDMAAGKPDPEGYLLGWRRLRVEVPRCAELRPAECVVIEDAPNGVAAARAAGMACVGIATSRPAADLAAADEVVLELTQLDPGRLERLSERVRAAGR